MNKVKPAEADLIVAVDVLVYMHSLKPLFEAVQHALSPGGLFVYTTEVSVGSV